MIFRILQYILYSTLLFSWLCSIYNFSKQDRASKILSVIIMAGFLTEPLAAVLAKKYHTNLPAYSTYSLVEYCLFCAYFDFIIDSFKKKKLGLYLGFAGILFWFIDIIFINHFKSVNSNFLFFEGLVIISLSLMTFIYWQKNEDFLYVYKHQHFWFVCVFVFFWTITYLSWGVNYYFNKRMPHFAFIINFTLLTVNIFMYLALGSIYLVFAKKRKNE